MTGISQRGFGGSRYGDTGKYMEGLRGILCLFDLGSVERKGQLLVPPLRFESLGFYPNI